MQCRLMTHSYKNPTDRVRGWRERKERKTEEVARQRRVCGVAEPQRTGGGYGAWRPALAPLLQDSGGNRCGHDLHLLPTSDCSNALISQQCLVLISFLSPFLWRLPLTRLSPPTFALPRVSAAPLHHHCNHSPPFIILSSSIHTFSLSSDALILSVSYHPPHTHTGMRSVNYLVHPLLHLHFRHSWDFKQTPTSLFI